MYHLMHNADHRTHMKLATLVGFPTAALAATCSSASIWNSDKPRSWLLAVESTKLRRRLRALGLFLSDVSERIEKRWIEKRYWDRAAPTVFALFMAGLVAVLVLSYAGVQIV
jgi:hypothetical protein